MSGGTSRRLFIVSRADPATYHSLVKVLADDSSAEVLYDRRLPAAGGRGIWATSRLQTMLLGERRRRPEVDAEIQARGWACVRVGESVKLPSERRPRP